MDFWTWLGVTVWIFIYCLFSSVFRGIEIRALTEEEQKRVYKKR